MENLMKEFKSFIVENVFKFFMIVVLAGFFVVALDTNLRSSVRSVITPSYRVVLAVAQADLDHSGNSAQILKVKTNEGLFLEIYKSASKSKPGLNQELLASVKLPDKKDGYFTFNGEVTNLAIDDIDNDQKPEILATSFDNDLVAHLNVYRYIPGNKELQLVRLD